MQVTLLNFTPNPEKMVAQAARLCYSPQISTDLPPERVPSLILEVVKRGHESVLEHVSFTFLIEGMSRAATHQLVRHRLASYSQQSQRWVRFAGADFILPPSIEQNPRAKILFEELVERSRDTYQELINLGTPREDARYCFIQAVASDLMLTANARELLHIFRLRLCNRAQWEIREGAHLMLEAVRIVAPTIFESAGPPCATGVCPEGNKGCGHPWKK